MKLSDRDGVWRRLALSAVGSILVSELLAAGLTYGFIGLDVDAKISGWMVFKIAMTCAFVIPAIVSPLMGYFPARLLKRIASERRELQRAAVTDPLTGLLNRRGFDVASNEALAQAARDGKSVVAFHIDIDHFKQVNDLHGHRFGDLALVHVAECLRRFADESGAIVARLGGEEFAALQFDATSATAAEAADTVRHAVAARLIAHGRRRASVSISVGVAGAQTATTGLADLLERADAALYAAKRAGRNCVVVDGAPPRAAMSDPMPRASAA